MADGSNKSPARVYDITLGYHYRVKGQDGTIMRFFFNPGRKGKKKRARR